MDQMEREDERKKMKLRGQGKRIGKLTLVLYSSTARTLGSRRRVKNGVWSYVSTRRNFGDIKGILEKKLM